MKQTADRKLYSKIVILKLNDSYLRVPIVLVGNKSDLSESRLVETSEGDELAKSWRAPFVETSAKVGDKVKDIFFSCLNVIDPDINSKSK